jgi:ATP-dependent Clp protease protease subunit
MIHQPLGGAQGQSTDIQIQAREIQRIRETINDVFVATTGKDKDAINTDTERDNFMTAQEAKAYGIVDEVITRPKRTKKSDAND